MKNTETQNTSIVTVKTNNPSVLDVINAARKSNPNGSIQIDELEKKLNLSRFEIIEQCRAIDKGDVALKVGRKGFSSCVLFGAPATNFRANRHSGKASNPNPKSAPKGLNVFEFVRIHLANNQTIDLPINSTELVNS